MQFKELRHQPVGKEDLPTYTATLNGRHQYQVNSSMFLASRSPVQLTTGSVTIWLNTDEARALGQMLINAADHYKQAKGDAGA